ncbi:MAG: hypothetical protein QM500_05505 [Methylococcales bacterium]
MTDLNILLNILSSADDLSDDALVFLSADLNQQTSVLDDFKIEYDVQTEGVRIDLGTQCVSLYKTKEDAIKYLGEDSFNQTILILEDQIIYQTDAPDISTFFENIIYWHYFKSLIINNEISAHNDELSSRLIFLSESMGKVEVGYAREMSSFFNEEHSLKKFFVKIKEKLESNSEFSSFFRDNFLKVACNIDDVEHRYTEVLKSINLIYDNSKREFNLYKNKFSFESFRSELEKEKDAYLEEYQSNLSSFLLTVGSLPIQFGVYIYLITKFSTELFPLIAILILILVWSIFSFFSTKQIADNINYIKKSVASNFKRLPNASGLSENDFESEKELILGRFDKTKSMLSFYQVLVVIFSLVILVIGGSLVSQLLCG